MFKVVWQVVSNYSTKITAEFEEKKIAVSLNYIYRKVISLKKKECICAFDKIFVLPPNWVEKFLKT